VTEEQCGTIELHLPRGSLQAGGARVSNRDVVEGIIRSWRPARGGANLRDGCPPIDLLTAPGLGRGCDPPAPVGAFLDHARRPRQAPVGEHVHGWLDCLAKRRRRYDARKASKGMVVVDDDGIMFGARWYALTPCGTRSQFAALSLGSIIPPFPSTPGGWNEFAGQRPEC
jgi:hypothetical protein